MEAAPGASGVGPDAASPRGEEETPSPARGDAAATSEPSRAAPDSRSGALGSGRPRLSDAAARGSDSCTGGTMPESTCAERLEDSAPQARAPQARVFRVTHGLVLLAGPLAGPGGVRALCESNRELSLDVVVVFLCADAICHDYAKHNRQDGRRDSQSCGGARGSVRRDISLHRAGAGDALHNRQERPIETNGVGRGWSTEARADPRHVRIGRISPVVLLCNNLVTAERSSADGQVQAAATRLVDTRRPAPRILPGDSKHGVNRGKHVVSETTHGINRGAEQERPR